MDVAINNIKTTITVPQVDFNLLKELAKKFGWIIQTEKKSGIEEALEDVKAGRVYHAKDAHDLIKQGSRNRPGSCIVVGAQGSSARKGRRTDWRRPDRSGRC